MSDERTNATENFGMNQESVAKNISEIHRKLNVLQTEYEQIFYAMMNLLYLRLGFSDNNVYNTKAHEVNFRPKGIDELKDRFVAEFKRFKDEV